MNLKVKTNDLNFRYDMYLILSLFYQYYSIDFVECEEDYAINIYDNSIVIKEVQSGIEKSFSFINYLSKKENIKRGVFSFLFETKGDELPWGTLVGIRPSKIALSLIKEGKSREEIEEYFYNHYLTRKDKVDLCIDIANVEEELVNKDYKNISVYVGMPFCPTRCYYCSFTSNPIKGCKASLVEEYLTALKYEIKSMSDYIKSKDLNIQCVYFGGGTPTSISNEQFEDLMEHIYNCYLKDFNVEEFTVECGRPDSITREKLLTMKKYGVHRISINPQTMNDKTLKLIGRSHSVEEVVEKFNMARELGFNNINMDIIIGLMDENIDDVENTLSIIKKLNPDNLTVHGLSVKRGSRLYESLLNNYKMNKISQMELNTMYEAPLKLSKALDMKPYYMYRQKNMIGNMENVGYCKEGLECIYNIQMIEERQSIIATGADAISKVVFLEENRIERSPNVKDVREYISRIEEMVEKKINLFNTLY